MDKVLVVKAVDNVATCLATMNSGDTVSFDVAGKRLKLVLADDIPYGHKFAVAPIEAGEAVLKYAETIGVASVAISPGEWVHVHNVESVRARGDRATFQAESE